MKVSYKLAILHATYVQLTYVQFTIALDKKHDRIWDYNLIVDCNITKLPKKIVSR